jgi:hypothetical protein
MHKLVNMSFIITTKSGNFHMPMIEMSAGMWQYEHLHVKLGQCVMLD